MITCFQSVSFLDIFFEGRCSKTASCGQLRPARVVEVSTTYFQNRRCFLWIKRGDEVRRTHTTTKLLSCDRLRRSVCFAVPGEERVLKHRLRYVLRNRRVIVHQRDEASGLRAASQEHAANV